MKDDRSSQPHGEPPRRANTVGRPRVLSKERIINAARDLPFDEISFPTVASKVGVSSQALYKYFPNAGALRAAIAAALVREIGVKEAWNTNSGSRQEFIDFLKKLSENYRAWLRINNLNPELFGLAYGGTRFKNGHETPVLLERLETFLHIAASAEISPKDAFEMWGIITDRMTSTGTMEVPEDHDAEFRANLKQASAGSEQEFPFIQEFLRSDLPPAIESDKYYEILHEALRRGLADLYNLSSSAPDASERAPDDPGVE
jgi:AcrR family transcriptional regulator